MKLIDTTHQLFTPAEADRYADAHNAYDEGGWHYKAVHDPAGTGHSYIEVYDEYGEYVGRL
jgi:hypothetical protein